MSKAAYLPITLSAKEANPLINSLYESCSRDIEIVSKALREDNLLKQEKRVKKIIDHVEAFLRFAVDLGNSRAIRDSQL